MSEFHKTGLDVIFYGQEHYDTMAIVSESSAGQLTQDKQDETRKLMSGQKLLTNKDLLSRNFQEVITNLDKCDQYIEQIIVSRLTSLIGSVCLIDCLFTAVYSVCGSNSFGVLIAFSVLVLVGKWRRG